MLSRLAHLYCLYQDTMTSRRWLFLLLVNCFMGAFQCHNESQQCALWMQYEESVETHCRCVMLFTSLCTQNTVAPSSLYCIGYDNITHSLCTGQCPYSHYQQEYSKNLNSSVTYSEFNEIMCGPLNREGLLCSKCKPGYGIPVFSKVADECVECSSKLTSSLLYLALELIPLTFFYLVVIIFNFSATQPPITAYIFYCQLFTQIGYNIPFIKYLFQVRSNPYLLHLTWSIGDIWNLDILRYVIPPFCLSDQLGSFDAVFLELISALYPLLLIVLTIILIEMHANNSRIIVCMWKPFHKCFVSIRRSWDPRSSVINAFATFLLLSSFKICFLINKLITKTKLFYDNYYGTSVLALDPTLEFSSIHRHPYFVCSLILSIILVFLPMLLLVFYPTRLARMLICCICPGRLRSLLFIFMESFQGYYKNGTTGTYDYRAASCIGFLMRLHVGFAFNLHWAHTEKSRHTNGGITIFAFLLIAASLFYALVRPCKKHYMNVIECLLYCIAGMLLITIIHNSKFPMLINLVLIAILLPTVIFAAVIMYKFIEILKIEKLFVKLKKLRIFWRWTHKDITDTIGSEPHRLTNPTEYTPLQCS